MSVLVFMLEFRDIRTIPLLSVHRKCLRVGVKSKVRLRYRELISPYY